jgi:hypothetical protein
MFLRKFGGEVPGSTRVDKRVKGIEPSCAAWEAAVLPLNYTRERIFDFRVSTADCKLNNGNHCQEITSSEFVKIPLPPEGGVLPSA